jgi:hypothetical protein
MITTPKYIRTQKNSEENIKSSQIKKECFLKEEINRLTDNFSIETRS